MIYLLDTHVLIWLVTDQSKISGKIIIELENKTNRILVSSVSFWEISIKYSLGKLQLNGFKPHDLPHYVRSVGFDIIDMNAEVASSYNELPYTYHRDPFDRMLIWQAIKQKYVLVSADDRIRQYKSEGLKVLW